MGMSYCLFSNNIYIWVWIAYVPNSNPNPKPLTHIIHLLNTCRAYAVYTDYPASVYTKFSATQYKAGAS